jgi:hypothetical protein
MPTNTEHLSPPTFRGRGLALGAALLSVLAGVVLFFFDPAQSSFYPSCLWHSLTGLACPGCGCLRALHQLLHGHPAAAFHLNPLLAMFLPLGLWLFARHIFGRGAQHSAVAILSRPPWHWILLGVVALFGVLRNLPFPPFAYLSP